MPYKLIEGEVRLYYHSTRHIGSRPDGDSAWFKPDNPDLLSNINGRSAKFNKGGFAQLRFEGIDALELHYPGHHHQMLSFATSAREYLLDKIGFDTTQIEYAPNPDVSTAVRSCVPVACRASILTRAVDPFGRPVAFVFAGNAPEYSGTSVYLDVDRLDTSLNASLIRQGEAYPAFYSAREVNGVRAGGLPGDLRQHLTFLSDEAKTASRGLWNDDTTNSDNQIGGEADLFSLAIWPKLYRRLSNYYLNNTDPSIPKFMAWLQTDSSRNDLVFVLSIGEMLNLSDILASQDNTIKMKYEPKDVIVVPR